MYFISFLIPIQIDRQGSVMRQELMAAAMDTETLKATWIAVYDSFELQYRKIYLGDDSTKKKAHVDNCNELLGNPLIHEPQMKWCAVLFLDALVQCALDTEFSAKVQSSVDRRQFNQHKVLVKCIKVRDLNDPGYPVFFSHFIRGDCI